MATKEIEQLKTDLVVALDKITLLEQEVAQSRTKLDRISFRLHVLVKVHPTHLPLSPLA